MSEGARAGAGADAAGTGDPAGVAVTAVEVVQTVQLPGNPVPLVAGKAAIVRVFLEVRRAPGTGGGPWWIGGRVQVARPPGTDVATPAQEVLETVDPIPLSSLDDSAAEQRRHVEGSLNVRLPDSWRRGDIELTLASAWCTTAPRGPGAPRPLPVDPHEPVSVSFSSEAPPLRLRVIGLRYAHDGATRQPRNQDYERARSWITRAYPVPSVELTYDVTDVEPAPGGVTKSVNRALAAVAAIRAADMSFTWVDEQGVDTPGRDRRTRYYGMVPDERIWREDTSTGAHLDDTFMKGRVAVAPAHADVTTVAAGPAGTPVGTFDGKPYSWVVLDYSFDLDATYGDWYAAHEVGHCLGIRHVDSLHDEEHVDTTYPFPGGYLGSEAEPYVGLDDVDLAAGGRRLEIRDHDRCHDLMSYGQSPWVSERTHRAIQERLALDEARGETYEADGDHGTGYRSGHAIGVIAVRRDPDGADDAKGDAYEIGSVQPLLAWFDTGAPSTTTTGDRVEVTFGPAADGRTITQSVVDTGDGFIECRIPVDPQQATGRTVTVELFLHGKRQAVWTTPAVTPQPATLKPWTATVHDFPSPITLPDPGDYGLTGELPDEFADDEFRKRYPKEAAEWDAREARRRVRANLVRVIAAAVGGSDGYGQDSVEWDLLREGARTTERLDAARTAVLDHYGEHTAERRVVTDRDALADTLWTATLAAVQKQYGKTSDELQRAQAEQQVKSPLWDVLRAAALADCTDVAPAVPAPVAANDPPAPVAPIDHVRVAVRAARTVYTERKEKARRNPELWTTMRDAVRALGTDSAEWQYLQAAETTAQHVLAVARSVVAAAALPSSSAATNRANVEQSASRASFLLWRLDQDERNEVRARNDEINPYGRAKAYYEARSRSHWFGRPYWNVELSWGSQPAGVTFTVFAQDRYHRSEHDYGPLRTLAVGLTEPRFTCVVYAPGDWYDYGDAESFRTPRYMVRDSYRVMATNGVEIAWGDWLTTYSPSGHGP